MGEKIVHYIDGHKSLPVELDTDNIEYAKIRLQELGDSETGLTLVKELIAEGLSRSEAIATVAKAKQA